MLSVVFSLRFIAQEIEDFRRSIAELRAENSRAESESDAALAKYREDMMTSQSQFDEMERKYYLELEQCRVRGVLTIDVGVHLGLRSEVACRVHC